MGKSEEDEEEDREEDEEREGEEPVQVAGEDKIGEDKIGEEVVKVPVPKVTEAVDASVGISSTVMLMSQGAFAMATLVEECGTTLRE